MHPKPFPSTLCLINQTIREYFEVYVKVNLDKLLGSLKNKESLDVLLDIFRTDNLDKYNAKLAVHYKDEKTLLVLSYLFRLKKGLLFESDILISSLRKINQHIRKIDLESLNQLISLQMTKYIKIYVDLEIKEMLYNRDGQCTDNVSNIKPQRSFRNPASS